MMELLVIVRL